MKLCKYLVIQVLVASSLFSNAQNKFDYILSTKINKIYNSSSIDDAIKNKLIPQIDTMTVNQFVGAHRQVQIDALDPNLILVKIHSTKFKNLGFLFVYSVADKKIIYQDAYLAELENIAEYGENVQYFILRNHQLLVWEPLFSSAKVLDLKLIKKYGTTSKYKYSKNINLINDSNLIKPYIATSRKDDPTQVDFTYFGEKLVLLDFGFYRWE